MKIDQSNFTQSLTSSVELTHSLNQCVLSDNVSLEGSNGDKLVSSEMKNHIAYFFFVALFATAGLLIVSYGGGIMLAFLFGIITIPFAIVMAIVPFIALTLVFSIPFYIAISWKLSNRQFVGIAGGIVFALLLSAGLSWGGRIHLFQVGDKLIAGDVVSSVDFQDKDVLITNARYPNHCRWPCAELLHFRGARSVSFSRDTMVQTDKLSEAQVTFDLAPYKDDKCTSANLNETVRTSMNNKKPAHYRCVRKRNVPNSNHQVFLEIRRDILSDETESYNPFANAIVAKRTRIDELTDGALTTAYQYTSVDLLVPSWVLWPISLDASEQTAAMKGLLRSKHVLKEPLDSQKMLFGHIDTTLN